MRDIDRIEPILNNLEALWYENPDMRLCQLLHMVAGKSGWKDNDLFYIEDNQLAKQLKIELGHK